MKNIKIMIVTVLGLMSNTSAAAFLISETISISDQVGYPNSSDLKSRAGLNETLCAQIAEIAHTFVCISNQKLQMNQIFTRMGFFWGSAKGMSAGTLISNSNPLLNKYNQIVTGHNLPGNVILNFLRSAEQSPDSDIKLNPFEQEFAKSFISQPQIQKLEGQFYLIALSSEEPEDFGITLSHEIHHARYYLQTSYRTAIDAFWKLLVLEKDKSNIRKALGEYYNAENEALIIDEFQAYILGSDDANNPLKPYVERYRTILIEQLKEKTNYQK